MFVVLCENQFQAHINWATVLIAPLSTQDRRFICMKQQQMFEWVADLGFISGSLVLVHFVCSIVCFQLGTRSYLLVSRIRLCWHNNKVKAILRTFLWDLPPCPWCSNQPILNQWCPIQVCKKINYFVLSFALANCVGFRGHLCPDQPWNYSLPCLIVCMKL